MVNLDFVYSMRRFVPWIQDVKHHRALSGTYIFATYNEDFAKDFGATLNIMTLPQYKHVFPNFGLRKGGASKSRIQTSSGGMSVFVGREWINYWSGVVTLLSSMTRSKTVFEANSPTLREQLWQWFTQVLMTRLMTASASIVIVQTRWHEDDLVGRLTDRLIHTLAKRKLPSGKSLIYPHWRKMMIH